MLNMANEILTGCILKMPYKIPASTCKPLSSQKPSSRTRCRWCNLLSNNTSLWNSVVPCKLCCDALLMATVFPSSSVPLNTLPNPPAPISLASLKFPVALATSENVYFWTPLGISHGPSVFPSIPSSPHVLFFVRLSLT